MKKKVCIVFILILGILIQTACSGIVSTSKDDQIYELKLAHFFPETHPADKELLSTWIEAIKEATDGKVIIQSYAQGTLLPGNAIYQGVIDGVADIGLSCFAYNRGRFPVLEVFELPGIIYSNSKVASMVAWEGIKELNPPEIQDTKLLMVFATGPGDLFTKEPVRNLEDLRKLEIRATGISAKTLELLGSTPVAMDQGPAYEALQKNVVQGNLAPIEVLKGWNHAEVTQYLTFTPFIYNTLFYVTINNDKWASIPSDLQAIIEETTQKVYDDIAIGLWDKQNEETLAWLEAEHNMELIELSAEESGKWISIVEVMLDDFIDARNKENLAGSDIVDTVKRLADKYNTIYK